MSMNAQPQNRSSIGTEVRNRELSDVIDQFTAKVKQEQSQLAQNNAIRAMKKLWSDTKVWLKFSCIVLVLTCCILVVARPPFVYSSDDPDKYAPQLNVWLLVAWSCVPAVGLLAFFVAKHFRLF